MTKKKKQEKFEFRIISGSLKGKTISAPNLGVTRPPLSRLRKSIFDFLQPYLHEATYLDLFSGTGSYLFEAVSRGVSKAVGVELESKLNQSIHLEAVKHNVTQQLQCYQQDVFEAIPFFHQQKKLFDIIMIAPPQYHGIIDKTLALLADHLIYAKDSLILTQQDSSETTDIDFTPFEIKQHRKYGNTTFTVLAPKR